MYTNTAAHGIVSKYISHRILAIASVLPTAASVAVLAETIRPEEKRRSTATSVRTAPSDWSPRILRSAQRERLRSLEKEKECLCE